MSLNRRMSDAHEDHLSEVFGGRVCPGSGNQPANPMDVRQHRYEQVVAFAVDGKSTRAKSVGVSREMIAKAREQAHGERPMLALRFYDDDRLRSYDDWALIQEDDLLELMDRSRRLSEFEAAAEPRCTHGRILKYHHRPCDPGCAYPEWGTNRV